MGMKYSIIDKQLSRLDLTILLDYELFVLFEF